MPRIEIKEIGPGKLGVYINWPVYGTTGHHWFSVLGNPASCARYGRLFIDRANADERRKEALAGTWVEGSGDPTDRDECPGAMFLPENHLPSDVRACDAETNQMLGRDLKNALPKYKDVTPTGAWAAWEVRFFFNATQFQALPGSVVYRAG